mmetsp:Transcript_7669/g.26414  ORF Transcript_7669/g.26414 Transcript_7669/m.26414 type:complete len:302 (-) Transcript_7669:193-1098(-)
MVVPQPDLGEGRGLELVQPGGPRDRPQAKVIVPKLAAVVGPPGVGPHAAPLHVSGGVVLSTGQKPGHLGALEVVQPGRGGHVLRDRPQAELAEGVPAPGKYGSRLRAAHRVALLLVGVPSGADLGDRRGGVRCHEGWLELTGRGVRQPELCVHVPAPSKEVPGLAGCQDVGRPDGKVDQRAFLGSRQQGRRCPRFEVPEAKLPPVVAAPHESLARPDADCGGPRPGLDPNPLYSVHKSGQGDRLLPSTPASVPQQTATVAPEGEHLALLGQCDGVLRPRRYGVHPRPGESVHDGHGQAPVL